MTTEQKHRPGCPAAANMAKPRSQQLFGPQCDCAKRRASMANFEEALDELADDIRHEFHHGKD